MLMNISTDQTHVNPPGGELIVRFGVGFPEPAN
jgi:hypothetical protein